MTPAGAVTVVHAFTGCHRFGGAFPLASVSQDAAGNLYGTTERGGALNQGSAWRISPSGQFSLLHGFTASIVDGSSPYATLLPLNGYLYGASLNDSNAQRGRAVQARPGRWREPARGNFRVAVLPLLMASSATLTWSSPTATTCTAGGAWTDTVGTSGHASRDAGHSPPSTTYVLTCTDGAGVVAQCLRLAAGQCACRGARRWRRRWWRRAVRIPCCCCWAAGAAEANYLQESPLNHVRHQRHQRADPRAAAATPRSK